MIIEIKVPAVGESINEVTVGRWLKPDGSMVQADEAVCEIESEKAAMEIAAERAGVLRHRAIQGAAVPVGAVIAVIDTEAGATAAGAPAAGPAAATPEAPLGEEKIRATPLARKLLSESGLASTQIKGTGVSGRITRKDVLETAAGAVAAIRDGETPAAGPAASPTGAELPAAGPAAATRAVRREKMTTLRQTIARRLVNAKNQTAMLTTINELDMSSILRIRAGHQEAFVRRWGVKVGFMSFFTRAVCLALREVPVINASVAENEILFHNYCDVSISVSTPRGLVVPVIRDAERKNIPELELEIQRLAEKARAGKLSIDEMSGGSFTITNGGIFGSLISTPLINYPQSAILGMHTIKDRPVAESGQVVVRPMMYVSLSYDHRIIDGRESVTFLVRVKEILEASTPGLLEL